MPAMIDTETRTGALAWAINVALADDGPAGLTLRNIARLSGVSPSSMLHHFGSREHLLRVAARLSGRGRLEDIDARLRSEDVAAFLPAEESPRSLIEGRAWLSWCGLWRVEPTLLTTIAESRDAERALLARSLGFPIERHRLDGLVAMADGLLSAVCAPVQPLAPESAASLLREHVRVLRYYAGAAASAAARSFPTMASGSSAE